MHRLMLAGGGFALALSLPVAAMADTVNLTATLDGASETKGGDPDGSGSFKAEIDTESGDVCYTLAVENIADVAAAHIHKGGAGKDGKPVATLDETGDDWDENLCIAMEPATIEQIMANPRGYYVNVHTADFGAGAVRGQLVNPNPLAAAAADDTAENAAPADETGAGDDAAPTEDTTSSGEE